MSHILNLQRWFRQVIARNDKRTEPVAPDTKGLHDQSMNLELESAIGSLASLELTEDDAANRLACIWEKLLGIESVGMDENYFDLGGDSSLTIQLFFQIEKVFGVKLPVAMLFEAPTIRELATILRREASARPSLT